MTTHYGKHLPAFILLFLSEKSNYGNALLKRINTEIPNQLVDGPAVYRALNDLKKNGFVDCIFDDSSSGPVKKYYRITSLGKEKLKDYYEDIQMRIQNLEFFISKCGAIQQV